MAFWVIFLDVGFFRTEFCQSHALRAAIEASCHFLGPVICTWQSRPMIRLRDGSRMAMMRLRVEETQILTFWFLCCSGNTMDLTCGT